MFLSFKNINTLYDFNKIYKMVQYSKEDTNNNYINTKYISLFDITNINFNFKNKIQYNFNIVSTTSFKQLYQQLLKINNIAAKSFKEKLIKYNCFQKNIIIFNIDYLIKENQFNNIFYQYLKINHNAKFQNFHFYSNFFDKFFNFIIYKTQIQNNQKFGFNSLMSIKQNQKLQSEDLNEVYIYAHKELNNNELNKQLNYIVNKILEN